MTNKDRFILFAKVLALFIWAMVAIITSSAVWNSKPATFIGIVAGLNLIINGVLIFFAARSIRRSEDQKDAQK